MNDVSRLSWGTAHPKHLPAAPPGDAHSSQLQHSTQKLSCSPENGNFRGFYTPAKTLSQRLHANSILRQNWLRSSGQIPLWSTQNTPEPCSTSTWKPSLAGRGASSKWWLWSLKSVCKWTWGSHTLHPHSAAQRHWETQRGQLQLESSHRTAPRGWARRTSSYTYSSPEQAQQFHFNYSYS